MRVEPTAVSNEYTLLNCNIQNAVELGTNSGMYRLTNTQSKKMSLKDYRDCAMDAVEKYRQISMGDVGRYPEHLNLSEVEDLFWDNLQKRTVTCRKMPKRLLPIYAVDNELSRYPENWQFWNLNALTPQVSGLCSESVKIHGVNTPYVYFAMPFTAFAFHHEDSNVASINVHHGGASRIWYSVPSSNSEKLEQVGKLKHMILVIFLF